MKVVLFCGGLGTRLGGNSNNVPKPMVKIGYRPILWHIMKYYAHYGHKHFVLCLGYKADVIKDYFLHYNEYISNNFRISNNGNQLIANQSELTDWTIDFIDTGLRSNIGERLKAVQPYLDGEDMFLANYADTLTDLHLPDAINYFTESGKVGCFLCVKPSLSFHVVSMQDNNLIQCIRDVRHTDIIINGGYFIFRRSIFNYIKAGEELVVEPFQRLVQENNLIGYRYNKFWHCMDTFKEQQALNDMFEEGNAPWEVWKSCAPGAGVNHSELNGSDKSGPAPKAVVV